MGLTPTHSHASVYKSAALIEVYTSNEKCNQISWLANSRINAIEYKH